MQFFQTTHENSFAPHNDLEKNAIKNLLKFTEHVMIESGKVILPLFRSDLGVQNKAGLDWDPVTEADQKAEELIRMLIEREFPDHAILGEEFGAKTSTSNFKWIIDPIDGTRAFVAGMPTWATLVGLYHKNTPLIGMMHQPFVGEAFIGSPLGSWHLRVGERARLQVAKSVSIAEAKIGTTSPHLYRDEHARGFERLRQAAKMTRYGCDAYAYCLLAAGHLDIAIDPGLQVYDIAALLPIMWGAGAATACWDGSDPTKGGNIIAASSKTLLQQATALMSVQPVTL
jgi:myo-inositol-1(or 4)-monophosphatase